MIIVLFVRLFGISYSASMLIIWWLLKRNEIGLLGMNFQVMEIENNFFIFLVEFSFLFLAGKLMFCFLRE